MRAAQGNGWAQPERVGAAHLEATALARVARLFKALGDETRLRIVGTLARRTLCVCDLARELGLSQPTLSHHLKILRDVGLVVGEKDGQWIYCSLNEAAFKSYGIDLGALLGQCGVAGPGQVPERGESRN